MVGLAGLEPATSRPPDGRATRLRYSPNFLIFILHLCIGASPKSHLEEFILNFQTVVDLVDFQDLQI